MDQGSKRTGKFIFIGLPFILLILYLFLIPSPTITRIEIKNNLGYIADGYDFRILQLAPQGVATDFSGGSFQNFDSTVRSFTIDTNSNLAYVITSDGLVNLIDIADPANPRKITYFDTPGFPVSVAVNGDFAYIANGQDGIQVFSLKDSKAIQVGSLGDLGSIFKILQIGNLTYVARRDQGIDILDLTNFSEPVFVGHYDAGGPIGQMDIEKMQREDGSEWYSGTLLVSERAVQIVDFTDPRQPGLFASYDFANTPISKVFIRGKRIYGATGENVVLISRINDDGQIEHLANITNPRPIFDFAILENTAYLAGGSQGLQAFDFSDIKDIRALGIPYSNFIKFKFWIFALSFGLLLLWLSFFAQFVLPVRSFRDRQKIFNRLIAHLLGTHGPAIFIKNGEIVERPGESQKKGPGVVWLDTASAAVIRTATKFKEAIGPGVHFTEKNEYLAGPLDLHTQNDILGSKEGDDPFEPKPEDPEKESKYKEVQKRRMMTSALTRDGIEVVPKVTVIFRVDTKPVEDDDQPGSRFGYRTGIGDEEKKAEEEDKRAIYKAIVGEGIDPTVSDILPHHRVAWNQLPGRLAVDVWREYVAKFTLDELFDPSQPAPPDTPMQPVLEPVDQDPNPPEHDQQNAEQGQNGFVGILKEVNQLLSMLADWADGRNRDQSPADDQEEPPPANVQPARGNEPERPARTALQVINDMVIKRLTQPYIERLDETGRPLEGEPSPSKEYALLQQRGLQVISVSISNHLFDKKVEKQIVSQWSANWLNNAKAERERIERRQNFAEVNAEQEATNEYLHILSRYFILQRPEDAKETLRTLLMRTKLIITRDNQLQNRMSTERKAIEDILQWLENRQ